jgi:alpha-amylase
MAIYQNDIIYFILTDRFYAKHNPARLNGVDKNDPFSFHGGNIDGIIEKIPYLKNLGITALWITPVYLQVQSPRIKAQPYHGYWTLDFNAVDPHLYIDNGVYPPGSKLYVKNLADRLHENGIKLVLDMVVNHVGYDHPGTTNSEPNPTPIRAHWFNQRGLDSNQNVIEGELAGLPDLDLDQLDVIDYHMHTIASWIRETGIDCIRMDTAKHVERVFWNFFKDQVRGRFPDVSMIGEALVFNIDDLTDYQKYWGFDSLFDFPVQQAMEKVFIFGSGITIFYSPFDTGAGIFERDTRYSNHNRLVSLLDNHDLPGRFFTIALNHFSNDRRMATDVLKLALTFMFTTRGIPQLYYGTEIGMDGGYDPDNRKDFEWDKITPNNDVRPEYTLEKEIFDHTRKLIRLRKEHEAFYSGSFLCLYVDYFLVAYLSYSFDSVAITVIHNGTLPMGDSVKIEIERNVKIPTCIKDKFRNSVLTCQLTGEKVQVTDGSFKIKMDRKSALVLMK